MSDVVFDQNLSCEKCGKFGACQFGAQTLCADCYQGCGSCCPEFGADDLWEHHEKSDEKTKASAQPAKS